MKQYLLIALVSLIGVFNVQAQDGPWAEKVRVLKISYITTEVGLTSAQAKAFWPVYDAMEKELIALKKAGRPGKRPPNMTDEELNEFFEESFAAQEKEVQIKRKYHGQFITILGPQKTFTLYKAEIAFRQRMLQEMKNKRGPKGGR